MRATMWLNDHRTSTRDPSVGFDVERARHALVFLQATWRRAIARRALRARRRAAAKIGAFQRRRCDTWVVL